MVASLVSERNPSRRINEKLKPTRQTGSLGFMVAFNDCHCRLDIFELTRYLEHVQQEKE